MYEYDDIREACQQLVVTKDERGAARQNAERIACRSHWSGTRGSRVASSAARQCEAVLYAVELKLAHTHVQAVRSACASREGQR